VRANRKTFALTFSHPHGDNELQAEALAHVIARIREVTQAPKIDLVAWSKGGMSCRIYLSDAGPDGSTRYRGDVRRYVMLGTPNGGIDVGFAYPNLNYWILQHGTPAPLSWTRFLYYGVWRDEPLQSIFARGAFPGQAQMVARFDARYGRARCKGQMDVDATYDGTKGTVSESPGIDRAIADGGDMIAKLRKKPIARDVELCVLAGCHPWVVGMVGERRGPSDGLILVASVFDTDPMTKGGAVLLRKDLRALNHLALAYDPRANDWVADALAMPSPPRR
jgi:triacylglycerol lipase